MKKTLLTLIAIVLVTFTFAQTPQAFKYQAVARTITGEAIQNQNVRLRISIQQSTAFTNVYVETQLATTNTFGLFTIEIGNGTLVSGNFSTIDWSLGEYFVQIEMDETGGTNFDMIGTTSLLSVPYAIHAKTAENLSGTITETDPDFNASDAKLITLTDISNWNNKLDAEVDASTTNEIQDISLVGKNLTISDGSTIDLSSIDTDTKLSETEVDAYVANNGYLTSFTEVDASTTNEIQDLSLSGNTLSLSSDATTVSLAGYLDNTDAQALSIVGSTISLTNGGSVTLPSEVDASVTNEIQTLSLSGSTLSISGTGGNSVTLSTPSNGTATGDMQYWNGTSWTLVPAGVPGQYLRFSASNIPTWSGDSYPVLTTAAVSAITASTATCGGDVTSEGGQAVTARGVCWSTSPNPTADLLTKTVEAGTTGVFTSNITGLITNTTYYVRAYATNSVGTNYGTETSFTTSAVVVGTSYQGGKVAYLFISSDPGYVAGEIHGLIISSSNLSTAAQWGCNTISISTTSTFGTGNANTEAIVAGCVTAGIAAKLCYDYSIEGYSDWYLYNSTELLRIYNNRVTLGLGSTATYWSSSQSAMGTALAVPFNTGGTSVLAKTGAYYVRAIRTF